MISSSNPLQDAHHQILSDLREGWQRQLARLQTAEPIRAIDELIAELEELLLIGRTRVPVSMEIRLRRLQLGLPAPHPELRSRVKITHLMDQLFTAQGRLLRQRAGGSDHVDDDDD